MWTNVLSNGKLVSRVGLWHMSMLPFFCQTWKYCKKFGRTLNLLLSCKRECKKTSEKEKDRQIVRSPVVNIGRSSFGETDWTRTMSLTSSRLRNKKGSKTRRQNFLLSTSSLLAASCCRSPLGKAQGNACKRKMAYCRVPANEGETTRKGGGKEKKSNFSCPPQNLADAAKRIYTLMPFWHSSGTVLHGG